MPNIDINTVNKKEGIKFFNGLDCHLVSSSRTLSVMIDIWECESLNPYISSIIAEISLVLSPFAYIDKILPSMLLTSVHPFGMSLGEKVLSLSRELLISTGPIEVLEFWARIRFVYFLYS